MAIRTFYFKLDIYYTIFKEYYMTPSATLLVTAENGQRIRLAATYIRPFLTQAGIVGRFRIELDDKDKIVSLKQVK